MNAAGDPCTPASVILLGGPIVTREAPTAVHRFAKQHDIDWFGNPGFMR
jgi:poly(3-hydroxybutyrate) depolymerase